MAHSTAVEEALRELVLGNHILADHGVVDAYGHLSMRHPEHADRYFLSCSRAPEQVTLDDFIEFTLDSKPVGDESRPMYAERPIHGCIYAARPDVNSVCHNHAPASVPFGVTGTPMRPIWHVAAPIGYEVATWDIADEFGATDLLVVTEPMGTSLATMLGPNASILMRGHGSTVATASVRATVMTAVYLQENAKLLSTALLMNPNVKYLAREEVEKATARQCSPLALNRAWNAWVSRLG
jgi:HCOMODA/2-hydroxy-3-carboxy-muconic semialdehyde decarboxylase